MRPHFNLPDLTANVRWTRDWGHFQVAGLLKRMAWRDNNDDEFDLSGSAVGAGLNLTSAVKFGERDTGKFAFVFGQGIQNYMNDADVDVGIELNTDAGDPRRPMLVRPWGCGASLLTWTTAGTSGGARSVGSG